MTAVATRDMQEKALPGTAAEAPPVATAPSRRTGYLDEVWTASARAEGLQWEMDEAEDVLARAMRNASAAGAGLPDLAIASGMSFADIERLLKDSARD
ncbi:hypothetical protein LFT48_20130 [Arthrobacter sp. FW305-123]|nr:hypothetical protein LFT48_20130 [Arthrobacter sp. FW305-123]